MGSYRVVAGQNIYDVALHLYGSVEGIVDLLVNNPALSLETELCSGQELTYTDGFVINADVVAYNEMHGIVPSNGERHVYPKYFTGPFTAAFLLPPTLVSAECKVSGTGTLEVDWGTTVLWRPSFLAIRHARCAILLTGGCAGAARSAGLPMRNSGIWIGAGCNLRPLFYSVRCTWRS